MSTISIIGAGRLGAALALGLDRAGSTIEYLFYRTGEPSPRIIELFHTKPILAALRDAPRVSSDIVLITTQDSAIDSAARQLAECVTGAPDVFITSGALSSSHISFLREKGCRVGSLHPLVSVSDSILGAERLRGAYFCVEGDAEAVAKARTMVDALDGHFFTIDTDKKPLYHAAAVSASGHVTALIDIALSMLEKCGLGRETAAEVLLPLLKSTVENFAGQGIEGALTGPFVRGDAETFERQLNLLRQNATPEEMEIYLNLGERSLEIALRSRSEDPTLLELQKKVSMAKKELR